MKMTIWLLTVAMALLVSGCNDQQWSQLNTQGVGEITLKADEYDIQVSFEGKGENSEGALKALNSNLNAMMNWKASVDFNVVAQHQSVRPEYHYEPNKPRQISGYVATQSFKVEGMNLEQYTQEMQTIASFNPQSLNQGEVHVSEVVRKQALGQAYALAFAANQEKLDTLLGLSHLCEPQVQTIQEHTNAIGHPRAMMMEAKSEPVASEQTVSVTLQITWRAEAC